MKEEGLYSRLIEAYTEDNLTKISSKIIELYKNKDFEDIRFLMKRIEKIIGFKERKINKDKMMQFAVKAKRFGND